MHNYPNSKYCVGIVEAWEEQGYLYICSELCERGNLNDYIQEVGQMPKKEKSKKNSNVTFCTEESQEESKEVADELDVVTAQNDLFFASGDACWEMVGDEYEG